MFPWRTNIRVIAMSVFLDPFFQEVYSSWLWLKLSIPSPLRTENTLVIIRFVGFGVFLLF